MPSSLSNAYDPDSLARVTIYGPSTLAGTFRLTDQLCSQKLFSRPGPLAETFGVSHICCIGLLACGVTMLFAQPLLHVVRLPCLGL